MDVQNRQPRVPQPLGQGPVFGVHGDAALGHQHVDVPARRGYAGHPVRDNGQAGPEHGGDNHSQLGPRRRVAVAAGAAHDIAVGVGVDVDVEVRVDLRGPQDHHVQAVHHRAAHGGAGVMEGGDLLVPGIGAQGLHRLEIKALHVQQGLEAPGPEHVHHISGDASQAEAALHALGEHDVLEEAGRRQGRAAGPGLEGEALLQEPRVLDDPGRVGGHHQPHRVPGDAGGAGDDARRVADGLHLHHIVHIDLGNGPVQQGVGDQAVGDDHHLFGVHGVRRRVAQASAGGLAVLAGAVAHGVRAGGGDEGHVHRRAAAGDVAGPAAVGAELHRPLQQPPGDLPAQAGGHVVGENPGDHVIADVVRQGLVGVKEGAGVHRQIPDAQIRDLLHDHVEHIVAVSQVVVEGHGHAVSQAGQRNGLPDGLYHFRAHCASSLPRPSSRAAAMVCCARFTMGASIILPRRAMAPRPCSLASRMASMTS